MGEFNNNVSPESVERAKFRLISDVSQTLVRWEKSKEKIMFPESVKDYEPIIFTGGRIEDYPKNHAAKSLRKGIGEGEVLIILKSEPSNLLYKVGIWRPQVLFRESNKILISAFFGSNFYEVVKKLNRDSNEAIEECLSKLIYYDIKASADNRSRVSLGNETKSIIRSYEDVQDALNLNV